MIPNHFPNELPEISGVGSAVNGFTGIMASSLALITSFQTELDWWVRFSSSVILLAISIVSLYNMISQIIVKWRKKR
jgi:hypothetical protein